MYGIDVSCSSTCMIDTKLTTSSTLLSFEDDLGERIRDRASVKSHERMLQEKMGKLRLVVEIRGQI